MFYLGIPAVFVGSSQDTILERVIRSACSFILLCPLIASSTYACPDSFSRLVPDDDLTINYQAAFETQLEVVKRGIQEQFPKVTNVKVAERPGTDYTYAFHLQLVRNLSTETLGVTRVGYEINEGRISALFEVEGRLRELGISHLLALAILRRHPKITAFDAGLTRLNASNFIVAMAVEVAGAELKSLSYKHSRDKAYRASVEALFREEINALQPGDDVIEYRNRTIVSVRGTPAGRTRYKVGFDRLTECVIEIDVDGSITATGRYEKGAALSDDDVRIFISRVGEGDKPTKIELLPNGQIRQASPQDLNN